MNTISCDVCGRGIDVTMPYKRVGVFVRGVAIKEEGKYKDVCSECGIKLDAFFSKDI